MSVYVEEKKLSKEQQLYISQKLYIEETNTMGYRPRIHKLFEITQINDTKCVILPLAVFSLFKGNKIHKEPIRTYDTTHHPNDILQHKKISGEIRQDFSLYESQQKVIDKALENLRMYRTCLLNLSCAFGKTCMSIYLAQKLKLKWIFITPRKILVKQTLRDALKVSATQRIQIISKKDKNNKRIFDKHADGYIVTNMLFPKLTYEDISDIGLIILDEFHTLCTKGFYPSLFKIFPKYILALTATPYRRDGLDALIPLYIDSRSIIKAEIIIPFNLLSLYTNFIPIIKKNKMDSVDWTSVIEQQSMTVWRNKAIASLAERFMDDKPIILCKRKDQLREIAYFLKKKHIRTATLYENQMEYDLNAQVLVAIIGKAGLGFDGDFNVCIFACDITDPHQVAGRIGRRMIKRDKNTCEINDERKPLIIDIIDNNYTLREKHYKKSRLIWYMNHGMVKNTFGVIKENYTIIGIDRKDYLNVLKTNDTKK